MLKLTLRNVLRHPLRAGLTVLGMALAILAFALLRTMVEAWYAGVDASSPVRLVTRNAVSLMANLPLAYEAKIRAVPGVTGVGHAYWFEGVYIDKKHFFPQFTISFPGYLDLIPELLFPEDQRLALIQDRQGALVGRKLAARFGWKIGDSIILQGTYFPGEYKLNLRGIYKGRDPSTDETMLLFHWEYLNEQMKKLAPDRADKVGWFLVQIASPDLAPEVSAKIDALFKNSLAETLTETEKAFNLGFVAMTEAILVAIQAVSWLVIGVILLVLANTMAMSARERLGEYAVMKAMGFRPRFLTLVIMGESLVLALMGGVLGLALTPLLVWSFPSSVMQYFGVFNVTAETLLVGLGLSLAVGVLAAALPAYRASRVGIAAALRRVG
ncbi:MAG: FtsX-like permease family protein [Syntrophales bacterium]|nr:FtsX-like permease family protein [Syntrophales bacterium]MDD5640080.1 FtsX-like permease family protein [Syntrophales bacterium]